MKLKLVEEPNAQLRVINLATGEDLEGVESVTIKAIKGGACVVTLELDSVAIDIESNPPSNAESAT